VNSPAGPSPASDQIYQADPAIRQEHGKPVIAFMQAWPPPAAIMPPWRVTRSSLSRPPSHGSIGVITGHFVFGRIARKQTGNSAGLSDHGREEGLPSSFRAPATRSCNTSASGCSHRPTSASSRLVEEGRQKVLSPDKVHLLADGSIYVAPQGARRWADRQDRVSR